MSPVTIMSRAELTLTFQFLFKLNTVLKKLKSCMILFQYYTYRPRGNGHCLLEFERFRGKSQIDHFGSVVNQEIFPPPMI